MAGSYQHCCNDDGSFTFDLLDNMGDAHEACDEMHWMIDYLSSGDPRRVAKACKAFILKTAEEQP